MPRLTLPNDARLWPLVKKAVSDWLADFAPSMGAALSYYTLFSLAPLFLIVIAVAGQVFGPEAVRGEIFIQLRGLIGPDGAAAVEDLIKNAGEPKSGALATLFGGIALILGATGVFGELQSDLNRIWKAPAQKRGGIKRILRNKLLALGMVLGVGFLLLVSLVFTAAISALGEWWSGWFAGFELVVQAVNFAISLALITGLFAMIYKFLPQVKIDWEDVWVGSLATALLFTTGKTAIGYYIGRRDLGEVYGAAASIVVLLVWVYYATQIFLLGAEFTHVYAHTHGSRSHGHAPEVSHAHAK